MSYSLQFLKVKGAANINLFRVSDNRGDFSRIFRQADEISKDLDFKGVLNIYLSQNTNFHTLRGFHRQRAPYEESKIITCLSGKALHVILRREKDFFIVDSNLISYELGNASFVPRDCFSAFLTLSDNCKILYLTDNNYNPESSEGIRWNDPKLPEIDWPNPPEIVSEQDNNFPYL